MPKRKRRDLERKTRYFVCNLYVYVVYKNLLRPTSS